MTFVHPRDELLAVMERVYDYRVTTKCGGNPCFAAEVP